MGPRGTVSILHITLAASDDGTVVRVEQRDALGDTAAGYGAGWYAMLGSLAIHLDGREPAMADWDADFALPRHTLG